jgi:glycosyltransferase involved in cell wall biosynthesis
MAAAAITISSQRGSWERNVDLFLALTEFARGRFIAAGLPEARIRVKPNFVDDPGPRPSSPSASTTVLYVGRISPEKGLEVALRAWASTPNDLELLVIGDGPEGVELEKGTWGRVRFLGRLSPNETRRHMLEARALLFPSQWYEGLPMVLLEAFAAGLPVVGSDLGSTAEVLSPTPDWRVAPGDAVAWEQALSRLADGPLVDAAGREVRAEYEARYKPDEGLKILEDAYEAARREQPGA